MDPISRQPFEWEAVAITDYTSEAFAGYDKADIAGLLKNRLQQGRERLD